MDLRFRRLKLWLLIAVSLNILLQFDFTERFYNQLFSDGPSIAQSQLHQALCGNSFAENTSSPHSSIIAASSSARTSSNTSIKLKHSTPLLFAVNFLLKAPVQTHIEVETTLSSHIANCISGLSPPAA